MTTATIHQLGDKRAPSLDPMMALTAADMNAVNAVILERMQSKVAMIPVLAGHLIAGVGKRMLRMMGVPVRGTLEDLDKIIPKFELEELLISSKTIDAAREARARAICSAHGIPVRRLFFDIT